MLLLSVLPFIPLEAKKPVELRVGTYNLRRAGLDKKSPDYNWKVREPRLIQSILDNEFDICGLQEVDSPQQESIPRMLAEAGSEYGSYFFSPYAEDGVGSKAHGIIWRKDRFRLVGKPHFFWTSEPPELKQVNDPGSKGKNKFIRGGFAVILKDRKAGKKYCVMVTHAPLNHEKHAENAHVYVDMEKKFNPRGWPSFFVGDMNIQETGEPSAVYRSHWTDSYHCFDASPELRAGPVGTYNDWILDRVHLMRIDFIYYRGKGVTPLRYTCNDKLYDGVFASDHFPVWVDFEIK